jgi:hypothetical protein
MFLAERFTSWKNGRQLDIMNKKGELLLRANKKKKKWFGPELEVFYTVKMSKDRVYEVRWNGNWEMSDGKTVYDFHEHDGHSQSIFRDHVQVAVVKWESTFSDEDIIYIEMNEEDDLLLIVGFLMIFTMVSKQDTEFTINVRSGL